MIIHLIHQAVTGQTPIATVALDILSHIWISLQ